MFRPLMQIVTVLMLLAMATGASAGTILQYHHVAEDTPPQTSVTPAQFAHHLAQLHREGFQVVRLDALLASARAGEDTTDQVAITFDDAYVSIGEQAMPLLARYGWPAAVFVSTSQIGGREMLTRQQLRDMVAGGHLVLNHGREHLHVVRHRDGESEHQRLYRIRNDLLAAQQWLEAELGSVPRILAWPYGEHDAATRALAAELGFVALAQVTGAVGRHTDWQAVPRIAVNQRYAQWAPLRDKLRAQPLPAEVLAPADGVTASPRPLLTLALSVSPRSLNCFIGGQPQSLDGVLDMGNGRWQVQLRPARDLAPGRHRVTCTRPVEDGRFQWFSWLWMVKGPQGWYRES